MMDKVIKFLLLLIISFAQTYNPEEELLYGNFPDNFIWGAATSAYQVMTCKFGNQLLPIIHSILHQRRVKKDILNFELEFFLSSTFC